MSWLVVTHEVDDQGLQRLNRPRNDIVSEEQTRPGRFRLADGPFGFYERSLVARAERGKPGRHRVVETIHYDLAVPYWGWLVRFPVRRAVRTHRTGDGSQPFWAPPQRLDPRAAALMGTLAAAVLLTGFLGNAPAETHTYAADEFGVDQLSQGLLGAVVRIGTIIAIGASVMADRRGRRQVLGVAMVVGIIGSVAAAFSPNILAFTAVLVVTRTANAALGAMVAILAVEEMPSGCRAWALSVLAMSAALGAGAVVWVQPVAGIAEWSWRIIFLIPIVMIPFVLGIMRRLPESRRFERRQKAVALGEYWPRMVLLGSVFFLISLFLSPIDWFRNEYLRDEHGFSASRVSLFILTTATPAGIGLYFAGRIADIRGRRVVVATAVTVGLGSIVLFFNAGGAALWWLALLAGVVSSGLLPALGVFRGEMFPTAIRARAGSIAGVFGVVGGAVGILLAGWLRVEWGTFGPVMSLLWAGPVLAAGVVWFRFIEGTRRELEELNPEDST